MSEPRIPIGMSFCGFFASLSGLETASNPIYAKEKPPLAPRATPDQPNAPNELRSAQKYFPILMRDRGMLGERTARATAMKVSTAANFTKTMPY